MKTLIDEQKYWLGAVWGIYLKKDDIFIIGNTFIRRYETIYSKWGN